MLLKFTIWHNCSASSFAFKMVSEDGRGSLLAEWDSSSPPFQRWTFRRWNVQCVFLWNVTKVQKFALPSSVKRKSQSSTCSRSFQLCCNYCDSWCIPWIWKCHCCIFVHLQATHGKKVRYILLWSGENRGIELSWFPGRILAEIKAMPYRLE